MRNLSSIRNGIKNISGSINRMQIEGGGILKPKVKVGFYLSGDDVDFNILTEEIGIVPTKVRKKADWPQVSISMGIAKDSWLLETQKEECKTISNQLDKMCEMLFPKVDVIRTLIQK